MTTPTIGALLCFMEIIDDDEADMIIRRRSCGRIVGIVVLMLAGLVALATAVGGALPLYTRLRDIEMRYLIGFASGVMISTAFFEILPEVEAFSFISSLVFLSQKRYCVD